MASSFIVSAALKSSVATDVVGSAESYIHVSACESIDQVSASGIGYHFDLGDIDALFFSAIPKLTHRSIRSCVPPSQPHLICSGLALIAEPRHPTISRSSRSDSQIPRGIRRSWQCRYGLQSEGNIFSPGGRYALLPSASARRVYPLGAALSASTVPGMPFPPGLAVTFTLTPHLSDNIFAPTLATMSVLPPTDHGTITVTGLFGYFPCAFTPCTPKKNGKQRDDDRQGNNQSDFLFLHEPPDFD